MGNRKRLILVASDLTHSLIELGNLFQSIVVVLLTAAWAS